MDELKDVLEKVAEKLKGDLDKKQEELDALSPHFENEADALAYAKRLMARSLAMRR